MDEEDRYSASSAESDRDNENENENDGDEVMEDADEGDNEGYGDADVDGDADEDNNEDEDEDDDAGGTTGDKDDDGDADDNDRETGTAGGTEGEDGSGHAETQSGLAANVKSEGTQSEEKRGRTPTGSPGGYAPWRPKLRPEALKARLYDIVPTMAAPQSTSVNAMAITPDLRYWFTGGSDGYIRKYDGPGTINGKLALTVAQRHPFVDSVTKAGILMSYWENEEPNLSGTTRTGDSEQVLSPVYSLAVHSEALWLLSGLESGGINLQSVRHDEGKKIHCLQQHTNAVSVLTLAQDEQSILSGGWDKNIFDWDLNVGQVKRSFDGSGGQISAIELRPSCGDPVPAGADELPLSTTMSTNNGAPSAGGLANDWGDSTGLAGGNGSGDGVISPAHESLFGGSDAESLFGETGGEEQPFGQDDYDAFNTNSEIGGIVGSNTDNTADASAGGSESQHGGSRDKPASPPKQASGDAMDIDKKEQAAPGEAEAPLSSQPDASADHQLQQENIKIKDDQQQVKQEGEPSNSETQPRSPAFVSDKNENDSSSPHTFLSAATDGTIRIWDRRVPNPVARIGTRSGVPPWCMSACWSPDGNMIYAGRRNCTVEEYDIRHARRGWEPERSLKFPNGSGAISAVKAMPNGRHLVW